MTSLDPLISSDAAVGALLEQAAATVYSRPALRKLGAALPADDAVVITALNQAAERRDAKSFSHLYLAALLAERRISGQVLEMGAVLLPDAMQILHTALRLEGGVAESLAAAVRMERMGSEREATAIVAALLDYERREIPAPPEFLRLTRQICRKTIRSGNSLVRSMLCLAGKLSGDPIVATILNANIGGDQALDPILKEARKSAGSSSWQNSIPNNPVSQTLPGGGATLKRAVPKAGRNDPCPCGSGRKFKQCCEHKIHFGDQYEVGGLTINEATAHPEFFLTKERVREMRSYELYALAPTRLIPPVAGEVAIRLTDFREIPRAIEVLKTVGRKVLPASTLDEIAFGFFQARDAEALRWLSEWEPEVVELGFDMKVLLAPPAEHFGMLCAKAEEATEAARLGDFSASCLFCDVGYAALIADSALGIIIARGVLSLCGWGNQDVLMEAIEDARDLLGLDDDEPGHAIVDATDRATLDESRHASDLEKVRSETTRRVNQRDSEIQRLKSQIEAMQETLTQRETSAEITSIAPAEKPADSPTPAAVQDLSETRELRDHLRRLKDNLKIEHDERNRALRDLRAAQDQLRRNVREPLETPGPAKSLNALDLPEDDAENTTPLSCKLGREILRIPEYSPAFREALRNHPRQAAAAALTAAARLAGGDSSIWKTVRALKLRPGTLRVRVAGDYRLLFEIAPADTLRFVDFILRRDLERWLASAGR